MPQRSRNGRAASAPVPPQRTDEELLEGIRGGSDADFGELYERHFQRIYSFAYARLRNRADAEEIAQEIFTAVFQSIDGFRGQSTLLAWIYGIAKNTVSNHLRKVQARERQIHQVPREALSRANSLAACTPEEQLHLREYAESINVHLRSIASWQAEVFRLRHVENLSIGEIARRTARSNDAIRSSLYRVKRALVEGAQPRLATRAV